MTESTCFSRFLWLALRVGDNFHGDFLYTHKHRFPRISTKPYHSKPPKETRDGRKAPNMMNSAGGTATHFQPVSAIINVEPRRTSLTLDDHPV
jgi:hypothetical protein